MEGKQVIQTIRMILAACGGYLCAFWGCGDKLLIALAVMMGLDYLSGVLLAIVERKLSSQIGFSGIMKKALILMLVGAANLMDLYVLDNSNLLRGVVICFYISNEGISLLENASRLGLPVPDKMKRVLAQLHGREEESAVEGKKNDQ